MIEFRKALNDLKPYIPGKPIDDVKKEFGLDKVIKIASNENPYGCSENVREAVIKTINNSSLYPDGNCTLLREALGKKLNISEDNIIFGCGTDELIYLIAKAIINKGDEVITAETSFSQYTAGVKIMDGIMIYSKMKNYGFDLDDILTKITSKTKMIYIANPNNPTGTFFNKKAQENFIKQVPENILIIFDEAYIEFANKKDTPNTLDNLKKYKNLMLFKTFSKAYGLASYRVGYGIASKEIISMLERIRNPFNVSSYGQSAALAALKDNDFLNMSVEKNREVINYLYKELDNLNLEYIPTSANFIMININSDSNLAFQELMKKGYIIRPGSAFKMDNFLRVTIGTLEQMEGFIKNLREVLNL